MILLLLEIKLFWNGVSIHWLILKYNSKGTHFTMWERNLTGQGWMWDAVGRRNTSLAVREKPNSLMLGYSFGTLLTRLWTIPVIDNISGYVSVKAGRIKRYLFLTNYFHEGIYKGMDIILSRYYFAEFHWFLRHVSVLHQVRMWPNEQCHNCKNTLTKQPGVYT